jgi:glutamate/tyrosine decarboxylase-like PLP-dependent enzyme
MSDPALTLAHVHALAWLDGLPGRRIPATATVEEVAAALGGSLPDAPTDPAAVIEQLVAAATPGLAALDSGRFFGFVIGGALPAARAADWLALAWDQNAGLATVTPAATAAELVASGWLLDLLGLPATASVGFVTGGSMANTTCLLAARHAVLARAGWDVEQRGLQGAPRVHVVVPEERHATIDVSLRYVGLGVDTARRVACDDQGRMLLDDLDTALAEAGGDPCIVTAQAGNVNTGSFDALGEVVERAHRAGAWVHVDGAFGLWAAASPRFAHLAAGHAGADSWATDAHKWLNVPYDSGLAVVADPVAHRAALGVTAAYLIKVDGPTDPMDLVPEFSRRARGFAVWAALRSLGRSGVTDLVDRLCDRAIRFADGMRDTSGAEVLNQVVLNQVLTRFDGSDDVTRAVVEAVLADGTAYLSPTVFRGQAGLRCSVSNWATTDADVDAAVAAVRRALTAVRADHDRR